MAKRPMFWHGLPRLRRGGWNAMAASCRLSLLDLGRQDVDDGFFIRGATAAVQSNPHAAFERRRVAVIAAVIEHPQAGPILFDTGCAQNAREDWPEAAWDAFPRNVYDDRHKLDNALAVAGYGIGDIRAVVMGHLHLHHGGGLENFAGSNIPSTPTNWRSNSTTTPWPPRKTSAPTCPGT
jgi:hypothetical protein